MDNTKLLALAHAEGYRYVKVMPTGEIAGLLPFMFTIGLCIGLDTIGYRARWCYQSTTEAIAAIGQWDGIGDPPGYWVKAKGRGIDRFNPRVFFGIRVVVEHRHDRDAVAVHAARREAVAP